MTNDTITSTPQAVALWMRRPRSRWRFFGVGTAAELDAKKDEIQKNDPTLTDSYTGITDPNIKRF